MMTNAEYIAALKTQLEAGTLSDRAILEGADELKRRAEHGDTVQGKRPRDLLLLAKAIREMVIAHKAGPIALEQIFAGEQPQRQSLHAATDERAARMESPFGRLPADYYGWGEDDDDPHRDAQLEEEARRQEQQRRTP